MPPLQHIVEDDALNTLYIVVATFASREKNSLSEATQCEGKCSGRLAILEIKRYTEMNSKFGMLLGRRRDRKFYGPFVNKWYEEETKCYRGSILIAFLKRERLNPPRAIFGLE